jgi:hypothetical protein
MAKIGWASELKTASDKLISKRIQRTGQSKNEKKKLTDKVSKTNQVWGWNDPEKFQEDKKNWP